MATSTRSLLNLTSEIEMTQNDIDAAGNVWELRRLSSIDTNFHPVRNPPEFRDLYGKFYNPEVWVITGKALVS
jgi:hypothetical protein